MKYDKLIIIIFLILLANVPLSGQFFTTPINWEERLWYEHDLLKQSSNIHTAVLPWRRLAVDSFSRRPELLLDTLKHRRTFWQLLGRKLWSEHLIEVKGKDYHLTVNPIVVFSVGQDGEADYGDTFRNSRGFHLESALGEHFSFYTTLVETQARLPAHVNQLIEGSQVAPGYWLTKSFRNNAFDYAYAAGEMAYTPNDIFHFRLGRGKQFLGEGYRSMLISDNTINYPFLRIETQFWKIKYVNTWAVMNDIRSAVKVGNVFAKKYLSMHYLSINITPKLNVGLFEGIMWGDELNRYGFDLNFLNPVILYRPVEFAQGSEGGNTLMGLNASYRFSNGIKMYSQLALDEFTFSAVKTWSEGDWRNMFAWQVGAKYGDAFGLRNLFLRAEFNAARPHTYSHREVITNWGHYQQPLAHPWGANFEELLIHGHYRYRRWLLQGALHVGRVGRDSAGDNWGGDIYKSFEMRSADTGVFIGQGVAGKILYYSAELSYLFNPLYNLRFQVGYRSRTETSKEGDFSNSRYFFFGFSTNVYSSYQDF